MSFIYISNNESDRHTYVLLESIVRIDAMVIDHPIKYCVFIYLNTGDVIKNKFNSKIDRYNWWVEKSMNKTGILAENIFKNDLEEIFRNVNKENMISTATR